MLGRFSLAASMLASVSLVEHVRAQEITNFEEPRQLEEVIQTQSRELKPEDSRADRYWDAYGNYFDEECEGCFDFNPYGDQYGYGYEGELEYEGNGPNEYEEEYGNFEYGGSCLPDWYYGCDPYYGWEFDDYENYYGEYYGDGYYDDMPADEAMFQWFSVFDNNQDGKIDSNELNGVFMTLDTDQNGFLNRLELLNGQVEFNKTSGLCKNYYFQNYFIAEIMGSDYQYFGAPTFQQQLSLFEEISWLAENDDGDTKEFWAEKVPGIEEGRGRGLSRSDEEGKQSSPFHRLLQDSQLLDELQSWPLFNSYDANEDNRIDQQEWMNFMLSYANISSRQADEWEPRMIASRQQCSAEEEQLDFAISKQVEDCSRTCAASDGCFFFHFDPNDGECLAVYTSSADCVEGLYDSNYYDFYQNYNTLCGEDCESTSPSPTPVLEELPEGVNLIRESSSCLSENFPLGYENTLDRCASACLEHPSCQFFVYDKNDGECVQEETNSVTCPEGIVASSYYNFYQVQREFEPASSLQPIAVKSQCESEDEGIGYVDSVRECSDLCIEQWNCLFFLYDENDGECRAEFTSSPQCPEGIVESDWYDFYENRQRTPEEQREADSQAALDIEADAQWGDLTETIEFTLIDPDTQCGSDDAPLGYHTEGVEYCAVACDQTIGCNFFIYDPADGECLWEQTTRADCPEGTDISQWYDFYSLGAVEDNSGSNQENDSFQLIGEGVQCSSDDDQLGYTPTIEGCAQLCRNKAGCRFVLFDISDGECREETTESSECPEGLFSSSYYNFYEIFGEDATSPASSVQLIGEWIQCDSEQIGLGYHDTIDQCADSCRQEPGCRFIIWDSNDGECAQELTSSAECPEGLMTSIYYNFYEVMAGDNQPQDDITLLQEWSQCDSENIPLGYLDSLENCAQECLQQDTCQFFIYDSADGECLMETTSQPSCPEGLIDSIYYHFYQVYRPDIFVAPEVDSEYDYEVIAELVYCDAEKTESTYVDIEVCAETCFDDKSCRFFHHDANDGECFISYASSRACPEGLYDSTYYTFYELISDDNQDEQPDDNETDTTQNYTTVLIAEWTSCGSENAPLGYANELAGCATECHQAVDCQFFIYDSADGECLKENTSSRNCNEGTWSSAYYSFYENVYSEDGSGPIDNVGNDFDIQEIANRQACNADTQALGNGNTNSDCGALCNDEPSCSFFHYDPNDGECLNVLTSSQQCPEGISASSWYDFYALIRGDGSSPDPNLPEEEQRDVPELWQGNDWVATLIKPNAYCSDRQVTLGLGLDSFVNCADLCFNIASCEFFLWSQSGQCVQDFSSNKNCTSGWNNSNNFNFYEIERPDRSGEIEASTDEYEVVLVRQNVQCLAKEKELGVFNKLEQCAEACWNILDCEVFIYDDVDGECFHEQTESSSCPEGVRVSAWFSMYEVVAIDGLDRADNPPDRPQEERLEYQNVGYFVECSTQNLRLGYDYNVDGCAYMCYESAGCEFFLHDPNDGECLQEITETANCAPGFEQTSDYYNFYQLGGGRRLQEEESEGLAALQVEDIYAFLTENAADICQDPRPDHHMIEEQMPPIEDAAIKGAFANIWFWFDTDFNGEVTGADIRSKYWDLKEQNPNGRLNQNIFEGAFQKNLVELCFASAVVYFGDEDCENDKTASIFRAHRCENNEKGSLFALFDKNEDGELTGSEFSDPLRNGDLDGDFILQPEEFLSMVQNYEKVICKNYESVIDEVIGEMAKFGYSDLDSYIHFIQDQE